MKYQSHDEVRKLAGLADQSSHCPSRLARRQYPHFENSQQAAEAAIARHFAIECDVQLSKDGHPIVFHDFELERLTNATGKVIEKTAAELTALPFKAGAGRLISLQHLLTVIGDTTPLVIELKSDFTGDVRLANSVSQIVAACATPVALKSFDPVVMAFLRKNQAAFGLSRVPLGMVAEAKYDDTEWSELNDSAKQELTHFLHWHHTRPDFLSWNIADFPHPTPNLLRSALNIPVMTWTVRTEDQRQTARKWADQIIFEEVRGLTIS